jgi:hypothetical protein
VRPGSYPSREIWHHCEISEAPTAEAFLASRRLPDGLDLSLQQARFDPSVRSRAAHAENTVTFAMAMALRRAHRLSTPAR